MIRIAKRGGRTGPLVCAVLAVRQLLDGLTMAARRPREALVDGQLLTDFDAGRRGAASPFRTLEPK